MITIPKYRDAVADHQRRTHAWMHVIFVGAVVVPLVGLLGLNLLGAPGKWAAIGLSATPIATIVAACAVYRWYYDWTAREDSRLVCPHCDRVLRDYSAIVIATRNCPHCGQRVLAD